MTTMKEYNDWCLAQVAKNQAAARKPTRRPKLPDYGVKVDPKLLRLPTFKTPKE